MVTAENYPRQFCYIANIKYLQAKLILMWINIVLIGGCCPISLFRGNRTVSYALKLQQLAKLIAWVAMLPGTFD